MEVCSIQCKHLVKRFSSLRGEVEVLNGIDLTITPGELFVLLGPSGCGKSTLLNLIAGLERPTDGTIRIGDRTVADVATKTFLEPHQRDIAMVFQSYALYPHMSVERNIAFPLKNRKNRMSAEKIAKRVRETAEFLRIEHLLNRKPAELSGGQRQRVAIGRALVREPSVLLMDEPLSNLDAQLRTGMRAQLKDLQQQLGVTTIYVTHDQVEAMTLGDRIAVLNEGGLAQVGSPSEVYDNPSTVFVARFVGSPPMNVFTGEIEQSDGGRYLKTSGFRIPLGSSVQRDSGGATIGIRPEHIELTEPGKGDLDLPINVVENLGAEFILYFFSSEEEIVVRTATQPPAKGAVGLRFPAEKMRVFAG